MHHSEIRIFAFICTLSAVQAGCAGGAGDASGQAEALGQVEEKLTSVSPGGGASHNMQYNFCGMEGDLCNTHSRVVAFGVGTSFVFANMQGDFECTVTTFGKDPAPHKTKACYISQYTPLLNEGAVGTATGSVAYGANGTYNFTTFNSPTQFACNNATFGDPTPGVAKQCYVVGDYKFAVAENSPMQLFFAPVAFGANGHFNYQIASGNPITCNTANFGDPLPNVVKACYVLPAGFLASEGQSFTVPGSGGNPVVWLGSGANGNWAFGSVASTTCSVGLFGADPDVGTPKFCWGTRQ